MLFTTTDIPGAALVDLQKFEDDRGFFARGWCAREFAEQGFPHQIVQMNISYNLRKHTLRGFHYQLAPFGEDKLLRCIRGSIFDVLIDLRPESPAYKRYLTVELSAANGRMLVIPKGCANAFLTMEDETEATYLVSQFYTPAAERGVRWDDPTFAVKWPVPAPAVISEKDRSWPDFLE
ncbi:dTDP-4-dehydrorhamnose 3,5-epimerase [Mesorhizobium sp. WSM2239]|uniref:dTDP-4-dehydrorhamnose 3,5-epimerase n=2 Tax=unclassified Mesorhizobium TaxID=325217 RepID=A0AAU8DHS4_9HYPH